jgi:hypothetical protein
MGNALPAAKITIAVLDRPTHRSHILETANNSFRLKRAQQP